MAGDDFDLVVIGSGPGGYVAAIRAAQLGMRTACVEKDSTFGGTCLNVGCIPSKALLESSEKFAEAKHDLAAHGVAVGTVSLDLPTMLARKDKIVSQLVGGIAFLFKKNAIEGVRGHGRLAAGGKVEVVDPNGAVVRTLSAKNVLVATGSVPASIPGVEVDGDRIGTSTEALAYTEVPHRLVVIGAGVIGLELGSVWARLGAEVIFLEYVPELLPGADPEVAKLARKAFEKQGMRFEFGVEVTGTKAGKNSVTTTYRSRSGGEPKTIESARVLVAVGRKPCTARLGAESVGLGLDPRGRIVVDEHFRTNVPGIYAIGDVIRGPMLAHKAEDEGLAAVEFIAGQGGHVNYDAIPSIIYTHPEIASLGRTVAECEAAQIPCKTGKFPFSANGRAKALGQTDGFVKIVAHATTDRILGAHVIGPRAGDLVAELALAVEFSASAEDIARSTHAHPTLAEVVREAALGVGGRIIHS
jgi:dihydrolipoamide dehydrogenase